jgi:hypothetical protein
VLAMGLPIMTALFGIGTGIALVGLAVNLIDMPSFSEQAVMMMGIGVASTTPCSSSRATARACTPACRPRAPSCGPSTPRAEPCSSPASP